MSDELKEATHETPHGQLIKLAIAEAKAEDFTGIANPPADPGNDAEEDRADAGQASGVAKLIKLGFTQAEIFDLFGVEDPAVKAARKKDKRDKRGNNGRKDSGDEIRAARAVKAVIK